MFPSPSLAGIPVASVPDMFTKNRKRTRIAKANLEIQAPTRHQIRTFLFKENQFKLFNSLFEDADFKRKIKLQFNEIQQSGYLTTDREN